MIHIAADGVYQDGVKISESLEDAAWNQGMLEIAGVYQKQWDYVTCQKCGHTHGVRRVLGFYPGSGLLADYRPAANVECPRCKESL